MVLSLVVGCAAASESNHPPDGVSPTFVQLSFTCVDRVGFVEIPEGLPLLMYVVGVTYMGEGDYQDWLYVEAPTFTPGETLEIPCEEDQERGYVKYAYNGG